MAENRTRNVKCFHSILPRLSPAGARWQATTKVVLLFSFTGCFITFWQTSIPQTQARVRPQNPLLETVHTIFKGKFGLKILPGNINPFLGLPFKFGPRENRPMRFPILVKHRTFPDAPAIFAEVIAVVHVGVGAFEEKQETFAPGLHKLVGGIRRTVRGFSRSW